MAKRSLKFLLDENLPRDLCEEVSRRYPGSMTIAGSPYAGTADSTLFEIATSERLIILTMDLDFGNPGVFPPEKAEGIIVLRFRKLRAREIVRRTLAVLDVLGERLFRQKGLLIVIGNRKVRIRGKDL